MRLLRTSLALAVLAVAATAPPRTAEASPTATKITVHESQYVPVTFLRLEVPSFAAVELSKRMSITDHRTGYLVSGWRDSRGRTASPFTPEPLWRLGVQRSTTSMTTTDSASTLRRQRPNHQQLLGTRRLQV